MVRYSKRRGTGMRRTGRKRAYGKTIRRSRMMRRYGKTIRRKIRLSGSSQKRWKKYYFERQTDLAYRNIATATSADIQCTSAYSPVNPVGNQVTPIVLDTSAPCATGCTNFYHNMIFKMSNLSNVAEFISGSSPPAGLFDEYKLRKVCIEIVPVYAGKEVKGRDIIKSDPVDDDAVEQEFTYPTPTLYYIRDYDTEAGMNWPMISEMPGVNRIKLDRTHRIWIDPRVVSPVAAGALGGSVFQTTRKAPWITGKNLDIKHYGLRLYWQDWPGPADFGGVLEGTLPAPVPYEVRFNIRYFFACRGVC